MWRSWWKCPSGMSSENITSQVWRVDARQYWDVRSAWLRYFDEPCPMNNALESGIILWSRTRETQTLLRGLLAICHTAYWNLVASLASKPLYSEYVLHLEIIYSTLLLSLSPPFPFSQEFWPSFQNLGRSLQCTESSRSKNCELFFMCWYSSLE